jgi:hypothetical protein
VAQLDYLVAVRDKTANGDILLLDSDGRVARSVVSQVEQTFGVNNNMNNNFDANSTLSMHVCRRFVNNLKRFADTTVRDFCCVLQDFWGFHQWISVISRKFSFLSLSEDEVGVILRSLGGGQLAQIVVGGILMQLQNNANQNNGQDSDNLEGVFSSFQSPQDESVLANWIVEVESVSASCSPPPPHPAMSSLLVAPSTPTNQFEQIIRNLNVFSEEEVLLYSAAAPKNPDGTVMWPSTLPGMNQNQNMMNQGQNNMNQNTQPNMPGPGPQPGASPSSNFNFNQAAPSLNVSPGPSLNPHQNFNQNSPVKNMQSNFRGAPAPPPPIGVMGGGPTMGMNGPGPSLPGMPGPPIGNARNQPLMPGGFSPTKNTMQQGMPPPPPPGIGLPPQNFGNSNMGMQNPSAPGQDNTLGQSFRDDFGEGTDSRPQKKGFFSKLFSAK